MKVTVREGLIYGFLAFYILYAFAGIGISGLLFSIAVGLIVLSFEMPLELTAAAVIISGLLVKLWNERKREGFEGSSVEQIVQRVKKISFKQPNIVEDPSGVLSSSYAEGFEDANTTTSATPTAPSTPPPTAKSEPAKTTEPTATPNLAKDMPKKDGFSDKPTSGMFKLGEIPSDVAGGAHIDVGTTMMNALNALKPDQVKQMTEDTRKLLDTQKSLMGMLSSMKPMLQDGKALMGTFNDMFGKGGPQGVPA
jgi:hypothetical protein